MTEVFDMKKFKEAKSCNGSFQSTAEDGQKSYCVQGKVMLALGLIDSFLTDKEVMYLGQTCQYKGRWESSTVGRIFGFIMSKDENIISINNEGEFEKADSLVEEFVRRKSGVAIINDY